MKTILVENHAVGWVHLNLVLRSGALHDPKGGEGLAYVASQLLTRGTKHRSREEFDEALDTLGAELDVSVGRESVVLEGECLARNLEPFVALLGETLREPALDPDELGLLQRLTLAELEQVRDSDADLCGEAFGPHMWGRHPFGRPVKGTERTVAAIDGAAVAAHVAAHVSGENMLVAAAGDVTRERLDALIAAHLGGLSAPPPVEPPVVAPPVEPGVRVLLVDKPDRSQTQVRWGHPCITAGDPDYFAMIVGTTIFGGTFTARLMQEIREKRGWSYGAYARLYTDRRAGGVVMSYYPAAEDTVPALALGQQLYGDLASGGVTEEELAFVKSYLVNGYPFQVETPARRMWQLAQNELLGRPADFLETYVARIEALTLDDVNGALARNLRPDCLALTVVCTAAPLQDAIAALPGVTELKVVPYDAETVLG